MYISLFFFQIWPFFYKDTNGQYQRGWFGQISFWTKKDGQRLNFITTGTGKCDRYSLYLPVVFQTEVQTKLLIWISHECWTHLKIDRFYWIIGGEINFNTRATVICWNSKKKFVPCQKNIDKCSIYVKRNRFNVRPLYDACRKRFFFRPYLKRK